jgi:hypothetical protein
MKFLCQDTNKISLKGWFQDECSSTHSSNHLSIFLPTFPSKNPLIYPPIHPLTHLLIHPLIHHPPAPCIYPPSIQPHIYSTMLSSTHQIQMFMEHPKQCLWSLGTSNYWLISLKYE